MFIADGIWHLHRKNDFIPSLSREIALQSPIAMQACHDRLGVQRVEPLIGKSRGCIISQQDCTRVESF